MGKANYKTASILVLALTSACSMQQVSSNVVSNAESFCANREYLTEDGYVAQHPADAYAVETYDHFFCGTIQLHLEDNTVSIRIDQLVRDYGGGEVQVLARTADMDDLELVQTIAPAVMDDAIRNLENGESVELKNISAGSHPVEDYVEWALADSYGNILNQDSYFIACNDTSDRCAKIDRSIKAKSWTQASKFLSF